MRRHSLIGSLLGAASLGMMASIGRPAITIEGGSFPEPISPPKSKPKRNRVKASKLSRGTSRYMPHQGKQEIARRLLQAAALEAKRAQSK